MSFAHLQITDGTTANTVNLLRGPFYVSDYQQGVPQYKNGGVFIDSPLSAGRRLAFSTFANPTDRIDIMLKEDSGDEADTQLTKLMQLFEMAADYWKTNGRTDPVWLEMRGADHTSIKYARIMIGTLQGLDNPFSNPYLQDGGCTVIESELILLIERENWRAVAPGSVESLSAVNNSHQQNIVFDQSFEVFYPNDAGGGGVWSWDIATGVTPSTDIVYDGLKSAKVVSTGSTVRAYQDISELDSSASITITVMAYVTSGTAQLQIYDYGGLSNGVSDSTTTTEQWVQLSVTKSIPSTGIRIAVEATGTSTVRFDDIKAFITYAPDTGDTTNAVRLANGRGEVQATHIFTFNSPSTYSSNLLWDTLPYNLLPSSPGVGDGIYIGSSQHQFGGGPFGNFSINLSDTKDLVLDWEYYSTTGWANLDVSDPSEGFSIAGEHTIGWSIARNWDTVAVDGVTGYWVRAIITSGGSGTNATQQSYHPYVASNNYLEITGSNIIGNYDPPARLTINSESLPVNSVLTEQVTVGTDDGDWDTAAGPPGNLGNSTVQMGQDQAILLRFSAVDIPKGAIIKKVLMWATSAGGSSGGTAIYKLAIESVDDAAVLTAGENPESGRTFDIDTENTFEIARDWWVNWSGRQLSPFGYIVPMLQAVVDRDGWASGQAMCFRIQDQTVSSTHYRTFAMYENTSTAWGLRVEYLDPETFTSEVIIGARSTNRGSDFRSCINFSPYQADGVSVSVGTDAAFSSLIGKSSLGGPSTGLGYGTDLPQFVINVNPLSTRPGAMIDRARVVIAPPISASYSGKFRVFVRAMHTTGISSTTPTLFRLRVEVGGGSFSSRISGFATSRYPELIDLGTVTIPNISTDTGEQIVFAIQAGRPDTTNYQLLDLILIPSDEWICEVRSPGGAVGVLDGTKSLVIDGVEAINGLSAELSTGRGKVRWATSGSELKLKRGNTIRFWMITSSDISTNAEDNAIQRASFSNFVHSMSVGYVREYLIGPGG